MLFLQSFCYPNVSKCPGEFKKEDCPMVINKSLTLVAGTGKSWSIEVLWNKLPILSLTQRDKVHQLITNHRGKNGVVSALLRNPFLF